MKKILPAALAVALIAVAASSETRLTFRGLKAEDFIEYITVADPYTEWQTWPGEGKFHQGRAPHGHGAFVSTYVNRAAFRSVEEKKGMAEGAIIVVENYDSDRNLTGLTTMYKVGGYNRHAGDWYWLEATPDGRVARFGKVQPCIDCHRAQARNGYIWTGEVVKGAYRGRATP
jgi:hypothetical protein